MLFVLPAQYYAESGRSYLDQFRDAGYTVTVASDAPEVVEVCENTVRAAQPAKNIPVDLHLAEVEVADYDAIVFIGGLGCQDQWPDEQAHRIAQEAASQGQVLGAAGCASTILAHAGLLQGKAAAVCSGSPPVKHGQDYCAVLESQGAICSEELITRDGHIVTARQKSPYFVAGLIKVIMEAGAPAPIPLLQLGPQEFISPETFQAGLGDLDGDGDLDAVFANPMNNASEVWLNDGSGVLVNTGQRLTQYGHGVGVADFDEDGDLDAFIACHQFVTPSRIYLNDGRGNLQDNGQDLGDTSISAGEVNLLDLNGDGHIDVHVLYYDPKGLADKVYLNDGTGTFTDSGLALDEETIAWGDLDGDRDVDYFGKRWGEGYVVQLNDGSGHFTEGWRMDDSQSTLGGVALADWDGDGDLDALVANGFRSTGTYPGLVLWNDGRGQFTDSRQRLNETKGSELAVGDLDNDGDLDVFVANMDWPNEVWLNEGGYFTDSGLRLGENRDMSGKPSLGDLDGDGDLDVVVGRFRGGVEIWVNTTSHSEQSSAPHSDIQGMAAAIVRLRLPKTR
ncbi:MAG: VCBS repeat-containing protein [Anaerolineae bacterium]|nr:VCBS repeat-containing protein [Anaerolineae bacterium]